MKFKKLDKQLIDYFICHEADCKKIFFNDDDNVCPYCGSKETDKTYGGMLKGEIRKF